MLGTEESSQERGGRSPMGVAAAAVVFLLLVLFSPLVAAPFWSPRAALLLVLAGAGLPLLVRLWWTSDRAASLAAGAFLGVATLSTAVSPEPLLALLGPYGWGTGLLFVAAVVGAWALGRHVPNAQAALVEGAFVAGALVNAAVAVLQATVDTGVRELDLFDGRAGGLVGNPVQLGAVAVAALAVTGHRLDPRVRPWPWVAAAVALAAAVELSGSRFALGVAVVIVAYHVVRGGVRKGILLAAALALGVAAGSGVAEAGSGTETAPGTERLATSASSGVTPRVETWEAGWHALEDRPVLGSGPGRFRAATSRYRTLRLVRSQGADTLFVDAHNVAVEYAATTGILGVAALGAWVALASRRARGPLAAAVVGLAALHLVQPQGVEVTPLALLLLGAAVPHGPPPGTSRLLPGVAAVLGAAGLVAGGVLLAGDFRLDQAALDFDLRSARAADRLLPAWPQPADMRARIHVFQGVTGRDRVELERAARWSSEAAGRDPTDPLWWNRLGEIELRLGRPDDARGRFRRALLHDPWSVRALLGYARAAVAAGQPHDAVHALQRALTADPGNGAARELLKTAGGGG